MKVITNLKTSRYQLLLSLLVPRKVIELSFLYLFCVLKLRVVRAFRLFLPCSDSQMLNDEAAIIDRKCGSFVFALRYDDHFHWKLTLILK